MRSVFMRSYQENKTKNNYQEVIYEKLTIDMCQGMEPPSMTSLMMTASECLVMMSSLARPSH